MSQCSSVFKFAGSVVANVLKAEVRSGMARGDSTDAARIVVRQLGLPSIYRVLQPLHSQYPVAVSMPLVQR